MDGKLKTSAFHHATYSRKYGVADAAEVGKEGKGVDLQTGVSHERSRLAQNAQHSSAAHTLRFPKMLYTQHSEVISGLRNSLPLKIVMFSSPNIYPLSSSLQLYTFGYK